MKRSITVKYTLLLTSILVLTIFMCWLLNQTFFGKFYQYNKVQSLQVSYDEITTILADIGESGKLSDEQETQIDRIASSRNVTVYILSGQYLGVDVRNVYPRYVTERAMNQMVELWNQYSYIEASKYFGMDVKGWEMLDQTEDYDLYKVKDSRLNLMYMDLVHLTGKYNIYLRVNYESIEDNVALSNKFLAYIGIISTMIGTAIMFLTSRRMSRPIRQLNDIAKRMADLDFNAKYTGSNEDEIGQLGMSMNMMSENLEKTISELKKVNNELKNELEKKIQIDEMRKDFLSNVSHELKTPIALIQGYAEGLADNINDDEESKDFYCEVIIDEANKMNNMVKKLLSLNQLEFGNNFVEFSRFDITAVISSVLLSTDILMKQKEITVHFENTEPVFVWADEYLVEEVITNYVSNAINHVGGLKIIEIKIIERNGIVRIAVFNTGEPIPQEELENIWIKFYKVDKARTREYGGSGMGLSIVKAIMNSLNRDCGVINHETGVEFWFELDQNIK